MIRNVLSFLSVDHQIKVIHYKYKQPNVHEAAYNPCSFSDLSSGHYGQVRQVRDRSTGTLWAGKFLKIRKTPCSLLGMERSSVEREVEILQAVQHPNIVTLRDVFESKAEVVLIQEL